MKNGFTLIELLIVVVIIGILTAIVMPNYSAHVLRSHRVEAVNGLLDLASRQARYYTMNNSYSNSMTTLGYATDPTPVPSVSNNYYNLSVSSVTAATAATPAAFTLQAAPAGNQTKDTCGTFTYTDLGIKGMAASGSVTGTVADCWKQ